jgi:hypothetical protein
MTADELPVIARAPAGDMLSTWARAVVLETAASTSACVVVLFDRRLVANDGIGAACIDPSRPIAAPTVARAGTRVKSDRRS